MTADDGANRQWRDKVSISSVYDNRDCPHVLKAFTALLRFNYSELQRYCIARTRLMISSVTGMPVDSEKVSLRIFPND